MKTGFLAFLSAATLAICAGQARAAVITQTATDAGGTSSFTNGTSFPGGAPAAGNSYFDPTFGIRTIIGTTAIFAGDSLTIGDGTGTAATLVETFIAKVPGGTGVTTIIIGCNLILNGSGFNNASDEAGTFATSTRAVTLQGTLTPGAAGAVLNTNSGSTTKAIQIDSPISGAGLLTALNTGVSGTTRASTVILTSASNTYTGTTTIGNSTTVTTANLLTLTVNSGSNLGSGGNVSVLANGTLTLNGTATLAANQSLLLNANPSPSWALPTLTTRAPTESRASPLTAARRS